MTKKEILELELEAARCRRNVVRMVEASHHGHLGGALSCLDIVTALYFHTMKVDPKTVDFVLDMLVAVLSAVRDVVLKHHDEDARPE